MEAITAGIVSPTAAWYDTSAMKGPAKILPFPRPKAATKKPGSGKGRSGPTGGYLPAEYPPLFKLGEGIYRVVGQPVVQASAEIKVEKKKKKKGGTRLIKVICPVPSCGVVVRMTRKYIDGNRLPFCSCGATMCVAPTVPITIPKGVC